MTENTYKQSSHSTVPEFFIFAHQFRLEGVFGHNVVYRKGQ